MWVSSTMGSPVHETEEDVVVNIDSIRDDDDWVVDKKRKQLPSKSRKSGSGEYVDGLDGSGRKKSLSGRNESHKRTGGLSRDSDQDECGNVRELRSKQVKKKQSEENTLDVLSTWYQDREIDNKHERGAKPGSRGQIQAEQSERKKSSSRHSERETDLANFPESDPKESSRRDNSREKGIGYAERGRHHKRRWDVADNNVSATVEFGEKSDVRIGKTADLKLDCLNEIDKSDPSGIVLNDVKDGGLESPNDKDERRFDLERNSGGKYEFVEEDHKGSVTHEDISSKDRFEEHRQQKNSTRGTIDNYARSSNAEEDLDKWARDKNWRDEENHRTSEPIVRHPSELNNLDTDYERSSGFRRNESGKDGCWDDRSKGKDDGWVDRNRERENFKDPWKRKQDKETRDGEINYENMRDWELPRRGRDRFDNRTGGRKDIAVKTSSKYGISSENYDVIEIQTKTFDCIRDDSRNVEKSDTKQAPELEGFDHSREDRSQNTTLGSAHFGEESKDRFTDGDNQHLRRDDDDYHHTEKSRGQKCITPSRGSTGALSSSGGPLPPLGNQELGSFSRSSSQGARGNRMGRVGRGRPSGRDNQPAGIPMPLVGSTFVPLGLPPPGPLQSLPPNMSPAPGTISPGVFIPPFQPPIVWPGARGVEMNMHGVPPGLPSALSAPLGPPRFSPNLSNMPTDGLIFNPLGPGRGMPSSMSSTNFNTIISSMSRGEPQEKVSGGWVPPRTINVPPGKAPSRGEQNDYSQNFVDTGMRPQNFIRELELTSVVEDYPKLRELIQKKDEIVSKSASPPMYYKCDLREHALSPEFFGTKFDVILVDPPWEEYVHRAPGVTDHVDYWTFEEIMNLKIEAIADTPAFIFLWVGDGVGLEQGRQCLKKWGFRRCEDICWVKTNKANATPGLRHDSHTLFQRSKEHCLMGIKGTVRRSTDGHIIHANIDTDVIIAEEPPYGSTAKPEDMYRIIEHFSLGRRRLELFGEDHNIRSGWLTVGKELSSSNFNSEVYIRNFVDKDGKIWVGGGGRNPPPEAPHLVVTTPDIESLRPKSPMKNQQQQQQSAPISLAAPASGGAKRLGSSPQNHSGPGFLSQEASVSSLPSPAPWGPPMEDFSKREAGHLPQDERMFDVFGYGASAEESLDYEPHRGMNML